MAEEKKKRPAKPERQQWKPHWILRLLERLWMIVFGAAKIIIGAAATVLIICVVCGLVFAGILGDYLQNDIIPNANYDLENVDLDQTSVIYCVDRQTGEILPYQEIYASTSRKWATLDEIPEDLIHAAVAIEDKRFYEHQGVDWVTTIKACARMFVGDASMGGSSLTQQLIKNLTGEDSITVQRKVLEIVRATEFEKKYDKNTIIEWYLNTIYLGNGCGGVKTAAETYFGKELQTLTTAECASLISITNNPSLFDPYGEEFEYDGELMTGAERNRSRQLLVLDQMKEQGWITEEAYEEAVAQEMVFKSGVNDEDRLITCEHCGYEGTVHSLNQDEDLYFCPDCGSVVSVNLDNSDGMYSWFTDTCLEDVAKAMAERDGMPWNETTQKTYLNIIQRGGYRIYSTIDLRVQEAMDNVYTNLDTFPEARSGQQLQSAMVIVDNSTGDIVGMVGGVGKKDTFDAFNRATDAQLQSGSCIKPLTVYAPAFELGGFSPATVIKDMPLTYEGGAYPLNDVRSYSYRSTIFNGIVNSVNAVAANTLDLIGTGYSFSFAKDQFGISGLLEEYVTQDGETLSDIGIGPLALGAQTFGVSVRDMSSAFATFPNNGEYRRGRTFTKVYDSEGNLVLDNPQETRQILSQKTVNYINYCLYNAVTQGTGQRADLSNMMVCGKTGTSGDDKDRWFCGYTGYYTAAVWCGFDTPETIRMVDGYYNPSAEVWRRVMEQLHEDKEYIKLTDTSGMNWVTMCLDSGKIATDACSQDVRGVTHLQSAPYYYGDLDVSYCDKHILVDYCTTGKGVATEYCKLFEKEKLAVIEKKALVKMTMEEINEIKQAGEYNLSKDYLRDDYIYLINEDGSDGSFKGLNGGINQNVTAPYLVCPVHTKEAWEKYQASQQPTEPSTTPSNPSAPTGGTAGPDTGNVSP